MNAPNIPMPKVIPINETLTRQVAQLARLELTDKEVATFTAQLGEILKYVDILGEANCEGRLIEPLTNPMSNPMESPMSNPLDLPTPLREDVIRPSLLNDEGKPKILDSAPAVLYDGYKVPPII